MRVVTDVLANRWPNMILISKVCHQINVARFILMYQFYHQRPERSFPDTVDVQNLSELASNEIVLCGSVLVGAALKHSGKIHGMLL